MDSSIQEFLDGHDSPVLLSDAATGEIVFINEAVEVELGLHEEELSGKLLESFLKSETVISQKPVVEHNDLHYLVDNETVTFADNQFIKSVLKPFGEQDSVSYFYLQQELASRMVHRLRSPLTGVKGFAELLGDTGLDEQQSKYLNAIEEGLEDLAGVLEQLKTLGDDVEVQQAEIDVHLLASQVVDALPEHKRKRVDVTISSDTDTIITDFVLMKTIIDEIIDNAFTHGAAEDAMVKLYISEDRIRIHNEGDPIPEDLTANIFYPFFSGKARSLGLGLARCSQYASKLGISLTLSQNSKKEGVSFDIELA